MEDLGSEILYFNPNKWIRHGYKANKCLQLAQEIFRSII